MKAALLSAFVLPGAGHFFLKRYLSGLILMMVSSGAAYFLISGTVERALQIAEDIQRGEVPLDVLAITELVSQQPVGAEAQSIDIAWAILIIVWLVGIVDSYRAGKL